MEYTSRGFATPGDYLPSATPMAALRSSICNLFSMHDIHTTRDFLSVISSLKQRGMVSVGMDTLLVRLDRVAQQGHRLYEEEFAAALVKEAQDMDTCWMGLTTLMDSVVRLKGKCDGEALAEMSEENGLGLTEEDCRDLISLYQGKQRPGF